MANPQAENGHIDIANEIGEALARTNLNKYENRYLWVLWRKTYGWHKKDDVISNSQFVELTGIKKQHIWRTEQRLIARNIVTKIGYRLSFQKDYTQWRELPNQVTVTKTGNKVTNLGIPVTNLGTKVTYIGGHKRNYTKETNTKEITSIAATPQSEGATPKKDEAQAILEVFYNTVNPGINFGNTTLRAAASWLVGKMGLDKAVKTAKYACSIQGEQYAPVITTPYKLKEKMAELRIYYEKQQNKKSKILFVS